MATKDKKLYTDEEKRNILAEVGVEGASNKDVAKRHNINEGSLYAWRKKFAEGKARKKVANTKAKLAKAKANLKKHSTPTEETSLDAAIKSIATKAVRQALEKALEALS